MTEEERQYISTLSKQIPGFLDYWNNSDADLNEALENYSSILNSKGLLNPSIKFVIGAVQRIYLHSLESDVRVLAIVNKHQRIDDVEILREFSDEANDLFYGHNLDESHITEFLKKYLDAYNPYICAQIARPLIHHQLYNEGFTFLQTSTNYTLASPNIYWNNPEAIMGCADTMDMIISLLSNNHLEYNEKGSLHVSPLLIQYTYLLLSRVIYFDEETKEQRLKTYNLPIVFRHKIACLAQRAKLLISFNSAFEDNDNVNIGYIAISDLMNAHIFAHENWDVGENSTYNQDAHKYYDELCCSEDFDSVVKKGENMAKTLAFLYYQKYRIGSYSLSRHGVAELIRNIKVSILGLQDITVHARLNRDDSELYDVKEDQLEIKQLLNEKGITEFYHFTKRENIEPIIKYGGLYSYRRCIDNGIPVAKTKDMTRLRDLDASFDLADYVRLSFCQYHPLINQRKLEGADLVRLRIKIDVAYFKGTIFSDRDAVDPAQCHGATVKDLRLVDFNATKKNDLRRTDPDYSKNQAEVMVKSFIPCSYIINIDFPETL